MSIRRSDLLHRVILLLAILMSGGSLLLPRLPILAVILLLCLVARRWRIDLRRELLPVILLLTLIFVVTLLRVEGATVETTAVRFANFTAGLLLLDVYLHAGGDALQRDLFAILKPMAWQALLTVLLAEAAGWLFVEVDVSDTIYHTLLGLFTYHVTLEDSNGLIRPDGFFYEPGVFQIYLNMFLFLALFVFKRPVWTMLGVAAVFSTQSTTGVVICLILLGAFVVTRYITRGSLPARIVKALAAIAVIVPLAFVASGNIREKVTGESQGSFLARQYDLLTGINVLAENPWLGIGFDYDQYHRAASRLGYTDTPLAERMTEERTNSNGIVFLLVSIGIPLGVPFLIGMFRQSFFPHRAPMGTLLLLGLMGEALVFTPFFLLIIFSGLLMPARQARRASVAPGR
jgi:O-Antigen ligase